MSDPTDRVQRRLEAERPAPSAGYRGELWRTLVAQEGSRTRTRRVRAQILAYATTSVLLLCVAVAGLIGAGPFAA
jgi:hypothetical protein